ncbi:hypothetical protein [Burkholderia oklahomensis]|uniref:hypothetical protein n=1 Tax=Burkholderia oklahomensis TaxID=342113 RepID=UPI000AEEF385|nr:hypothetical protein [Burkholderia oklahomensis]MBI0361130.1 hypothetical protein [Burkholderia oklahomensis]QPS37536.1 hypothetical protein I6G57_01210 [Burkholderia oklahomensis]
MSRIFRNGSICIMSIWCAAHAAAMSRGTVRVDIERIDGKPVACIPEKGDGGEQSVRLHIAGISRATGPASPDVIY